MTAFDWDYAYNSALTLLAEALLDELDFYPEDFEHASGNEYDALQPDYRNFRILEEDTDTIIANLHDSGRQWQNTWQLGQGDYYVTKRADVQNVENAAYCDMVIIDAGTYRVVYFYT